LKLAADDRLDIQDLCARYNLCMDDHDLNGFMACWAEGDVRLENIAGQFSGRDGLRAFAEKQFEEKRLQGKRRLLSNLAIRPGEQPDTAYVTCDIFLLEVTDLPQVVATGRFRDSKVVKTDEGWKFVFRRLDLDFGFSKYFRDNPTGVGG
jgi:hypothetical protein